MKKTYEKPEVYFESFELSASIAAGCASRYTHDNTTSLNINSCGVSYIGDTVFLTSSICSLTSNDGTEYGMCYDVPTANAQVFAS